jgi:hypothetical protein
MHRPAISLHFLAVSVTTSISRFDNVPTPPAGDLPFMINPEARYAHAEGPAQLLPLATTARRALVVPILLKAFLSGVAVGLSPAPSQGSQ